MRINPLPLALIGVLAAGPAFAATTVPLDFSGQSFDSVTRVITFVDILGDGTADLVMAPIDGPSSFVSGNDSRNEDSLGQLGQVNFAETTDRLTTDFRFTFVETGTSNVLDPGGDVEIGVLDLDFFGRESITLLSPAKVTVADSTLITQDVDPIDNNARFLGASVFDVANSGLSNGSGSLNAAQEQVAISINFGQVSSFDLRFSVLDGTEQNSRNFFLDGEVVFDDTIPDVIFNSIPLPAPALLLLTGFGAIVMLGGARRRA
ncbi:MAG: hypothetical protein ACFBRM_02605 [Pikeienuella sp.]